MNKKILLCAIALVGMICLCVPAMARMRGADDVTPLPTPVSSYIIPDTNDDGLVSMNEMLDYMRLYREGVVNEMHFKVAIYWWKISA